jgi:hypothetical protein
VGVVASALTQFSLPVATNAFAVTNSLFTDNGTNGAYNGSGNFTVAGAAVVNGDLHIGGKLFTSGSLAIDSPIPSSPCTTSVSGHTLLCIDNNGALSYSNSGAAQIELMTNPMTTANDVIIGGTSGAPTRLAKGANGTFLGVNGSGNLAYSTVPSISGTPITSEVALWTTATQLKGSTVADMSQFQAFTLSGVDTYTLAASSGLTPTNNGISGTVIYALANTNTSTTPTLTITGFNSGAAATIVKCGTSALVAGDLFDASVAQYNILSFDGNGFWHLLNPVHYCNASGTVSSIATTSPITGGTITSTGTIACATCLTGSSPGNHLIMVGQGTQALTTVASVNDAFLVTNSSGVPSLVAGSTVIQAGTNITVTGTPSTGITINATGSLSTALSNVSGATGSNTAASGNNPIIWNWAQTTNSQTAFIFGETTAATGTSDIGVAFKNLSGSTAIPLQVSGGGWTSTSGQSPTSLQINQTCSTNNVSAATILDVQQGGTSQFSIKESGTACGGAYTNVGAGSATQASIVFGADTTGGMYRTGANSFAFTNGTNAYIATSSSGVIKVPNAGSLSFTSSATNALGTVDTGISRDSAGVLSVDNVTIGGNLGLIRDANSCRITSAITLSTSATTVCSYSLPAAARTWAWSCNGTYSITSGTTPTLTVGMNASQTPTSETGNASIYSTLTGTNTQGTVTSTSSGNQNILTGAAVTTITNAFWTAFGTVQASGTAGTFAITATLGGSSPAGTIAIGSSCQIY